MARATHSLVPPAAAQALQPLSHTAPRAPGRWVLSQIPHPGATESLRWGPVLWPRPLHTPFFQRPSWQPWDHILLALVLQRWWLWRSIPCDTPLRVVGGGCPLDGPFRSTKTRQHQGRVSQGPDSGEGGVPSHPTVPEGRASRDSILPKVPGGKKKKNKVPGVLPCVLAVTHLCQVLSLAGGHWAEISIAQPPPCFFTT